MKRLIASSLIASSLIASSLIVLGCASAAFCQDVLREISWAKLNQAGQLAAGELQPGQPPADVESPAAIPGAWWDDRTGGMIGGILGSGVGLLGALIGTLGGVGIARRLVLGLMTAAFLAGLLLLGAGVAALVYSQPYAVWYPLLLTGILCSSIMGGLLPVLRRRYEQLELRKMTSMDTGLPAR